MSSIDVTIQNQYLTFTLGNEQYGINISDTREVLETTVLTKVPRMPNFMCGVINLRGAVVPVIDLKRKFHMEECNDERRRNIIVTEIEDLTGNEEKLTIGIYTDSVHKVLTINPDSIEAAPKIGIPIDTEFIYGMGKVDDTFTILLNINKILNSTDLQQVQMTDDNKEMLEETC